MADTAVVRNALVLTLPLLWAACDDGAAVSLPKDAARPLRPAAAVLAPGAPVGSKDPGPESEDSPVPPQQLPPHGPPQPDDPNVTRVRSRDVAKRLRPHFGGGQLAHRAYQADFGPTAVTHKPTAVAFVRRTAPERFEGFAVSSDTLYPFPALHQADLAPHDIAAIMFRNVDADPDRELVVLARYSSTDDPEDTFFNNVVLDWDSARGSFVRLASVEGEIEAFENTTAVLRHLRTVRALAPPAP